MLCSFATLVACANDEAPGVRREGTGTETGGMAGSPSGNPGPDGGSLSPAPDASLATPDATPGLDPCRRIRNVDLLFVVDNSGSMSEEQASLAREFPKLVRALASGDRDADGKEDFPPVEDLHLGVVSSDMGLPGIPGIPGCDGLGGNGILNRVPDPMLADCETEYPKFLGYAAGNDDPDAIARDFACLASLGTAGCGFEQQLEAGLKALWPADDPSIGFLGDGMGAGKTGHAGAENGDFLRPDKGPDISIVAIVVVTDEEDCSSHDLTHFTPALFLDPNDPADAMLLAQDLNLRCYHNPANLHPVSRYVNGYRALRKGLEQLVVFAAIAGVPPDLVNAEALAQVDFGNGTERDAFYAGVLADPRMAEVPDPSKPPGEGALTPSCDVADRGLAYPPRRITQVAEAFGENGIVQSICQKDFGPAVDVIVGAIGRTVANACVLE
jgi:hypothetical protein